MIVKPQQLKQAIFAAVLSLTYAGSSSAAEPVAAPPVTEPSNGPALAVPATSAGAGSLAPVALEADSGTPGVIEPAGRRIPAAGMMISAEEEAVPNGVEPIPETDDHYDGASVLISDLPYGHQGAVSTNYYNLGRRQLRMTCPECRFCPHGVPYHECPHCEPTDAQIRRYRRRHGLVYPPDYGWSPPTTFPIAHVGVDYAHQFPASYYGLSRAAGVARPMVYWPTDTTQLGYTYQHVPRWMPTPIPPVPHPEQWHTPLANVAGTTGVCGRGHLRCRVRGRRDCRECPPGGVIDGSIVYPGEAVPPRPADADGNGGSLKEPDMIEPISPPRAAGPELNRSAEVPPLVPVPLY